MPALKRGIATLEMIAKSRDGLTLSQLASGVGCPRSSMHSLLLTFERQGYVERSLSTRRYVCAMKILQLARGALDGVVLREGTIPLLRALMERAKLTVHMAKFECDEAMLIAKVAYPAAARTVTWIGKRVDLHCTSLGKCLIAYLPDAEMESITNAHGLMRHNENTIGSIAKLKRELARIRHLGYSVDDEEEEIGMRCIGVPVFDSDNHVSTAISVSGTAEEINLSSCDQLVGALKETASAISQVLTCLRESRPGPALRGTHAPYLL